MITDLPPERIGIRRNGLMFSMFEPGASNLDDVKKSPHEALHRQFIPR
jgi:hypothetical protein